MENLLFVILGPTGIGKTDVTVRLAEYFKSEIISSDSRQFYKELKIGTAVPSTEQLQRVKHHLIGNISIFDYYSVFKFETDVLDILQQIFPKVNMAFMVGGSGLYIDAVCYGIDDIPDVEPEIREQIKQRFEEEGLESLRFDLKRLDPVYYDQVDLRNHKRIIRGLEVCLTTGKPYSSFRTDEKKVRNFRIVKIGLEIDRQLLYNRIDQRVDGMIESGLVDEAKQFYKHRELNSLNTVGYKELFEYFDEKITLEKAIELIKRNSRRYAKRQIAWFKRDDEINWFDPNKFEEIKDYIKDTLD